MKMGIFVRKDTYLLASPEHRPPTVCPYPVIDTQLHPDAGDLLTYKILINLASDCDCETPSAPPLSTVSVISVVFPLLCTKAWR